MRYEQYIQKGDDLRINQGRPEPAAVQYMIALEVRGPRDRYVMHMLGVCCQMMELYDGATEWYLLAMEGASQYESGNIERDMAAAYDALEEPELAEISLATALDLLRYEQYPEEHAVTLGFLARHQLLMGQLEEALETFADADAKLHEGGNRYAELYNKLPYASALSRAGRWLDARHVALEALWLARRYGAPDHRRRAFALLTGGHRAENRQATRRHRPSPTEF